MSQKQKQIFTSTPRKRSYLWDTGQGILKSQQSQTKNFSDSVNPAASRVYRVVLWSSKNAKCTSKKTKKTCTTAKKMRNENKCANSQNPDKEKPLNTRTCDESQLKTGDNLDDEVENKKPKESRRKQRNKYKLEVNKEIQKWFSQKFNDDKEKDPHDMRNQGRAIGQSYCSDVKARKVCQKNYKRSSRNAEMNNKNKCDQIDEDAEDCNHTNNDRHSDTDEDDSGKSNEAGDLFDIWDLSEDKNPDSLNLSKDKKTKTKNKSRSNIKCSKSKVNTRQIAKNSKSVPRLPHLNSSQVYEFPESPNAGKSKATPSKSKATPNKSKATPGKSKTTPGKSNAGKKSSKKKKDLKDELVVNEILNIISKTKIEIKAMKAKILKQKTKHK